MWRLRECFVLPAGFQNTTTTDRSVLFEIQNSGTKKGDLWLLEASRAPIATTLDTVLLTTLF